MSPKLTTSKILSPLSTPAVASRVPSWLTEAVTIAPKWDRKCLMKSSPVADFFQNLTCPSIDVVIKKSVLSKQQAMSSSTLLQSRMEEGRYCVTRTKLTTSRCIRLRSYMSWSGKFSRKRDS